MNFSRLCKMITWKLISAFPAREMTLETRNGNLTFNTRDYVLGKHLFVDRHYEFESIQNVLSIVGETRRPLYKSSSIFVDVGANIGTIAIALMRSGQFRKGLAFEPGPYNFSLLTRNVEQNQLQNVIECHNLALSSEEGTGTLELAADNFGDHRIRLREVPGYFKEERRKTVEVVVRPLDRVLDQSLRKDVALIWLDIQGHEGHFLAGAEATIQDARPALFMEFWPYGLARSGFSQEEYCLLLSRLFSSYIHLTGDRRGAIEPISSFERWFERYPGPREMGVFLLF